MNDTATPTTTELVEQIPIELLEESPTNRRRTWGNLNELAASFGDRGPLLPLLARPLKGDRFEVVAGARRLRAGAIRKLPTLPTIVRAMTDEEVLEAQTIENLQREGVHALDEAEDFAALHKLGWSADMIAAKIGKSRGYVFGRLKLLALTPKLQKAFVDGKFSASVALYIARIPVPKLQEEALKELESHRADEQPSAREAFQLINRRYLLRLVDATFDKTATNLVAGVPPCKDCPKRTGNQGELFADLPDKELCTDPTCFDAKTRASSRQRLKEGADRGQKILEGKKADEALSTAYHSGGDYIDLDREDYSSPKSPKWRAKLKGLDLPIALALDKQGIVHELVARADIPKDKREHRDPSTKGPGSEEEKKYKRAAALKKVEAYALVGAVVAAAERIEPKGMWPKMCWWLIHHVGRDQAVHILRRRGIEMPKNKITYTGDVTGKLFEKLIPTLSAKQCRGLAVELAISVGAWNFGTYSTEGHGKDLLSAATFFKVNTRSVTQKARDSAKASKKKPGRPAKTAKKAPKFKATTKGRKK